MGGSCLRRPRPWIPPNPTSGSYESNNSESKSRLFSRPLHFMHEHDQWDHAFYIFSNTTLFSITQQNSSSIKILSSTD